MSLAATVAGFVGPPNPWFSWDWVSSHGSDLVQAGTEHVTLTVVAVLAALVVSFPLAVLARRYPRTESPILAVSGVLYTIPSLALIGALWPVFGLSQTTVEVALAVYALLVIVRNLIAGLADVPPDVVDAARGMGFGSTRLLWRVELPLAMPALLAGVRIATVSTIGLVTIGALVGYGGYGNLIFEGFQRTTGRAEIMAASIACVLLAVVAELFLLGVQRVLTPWARRADTRP